MKPRFKLKRTLRVNAIFSSITAISCIVFPTNISKLMGIDLPIWIQGLGLALIAFALLVIFVAQVKINHFGWVKLIIIQDWLWVLGSLIILVFNPFEFTTKGLVTVLVVAVIIGALAFTQDRQWAKNV